MFFRSQLLNIQQQLRDRERKLTPTTSSSFKLSFPSLSTSSSSSYIYSPTLSRYIPLPPLPLCLLAPCSPFSSLLPPSPLHFLCPFIVSSEPRSLKLFKLSFSLQSTSVHGSTGPFVYTETHQGRWKAVSEGGSEKGREAREGEER